jgi:hypothetical protein
MLNEFFCSVFTEEDASYFPPVEELFQGADPLVTVEFEPDKIEKKLSKLKPSSAPGPDKLWTRVLQSLASVLSFPLAIIYTRCLSEGTVPPEWKRANITPIFKKGSKGSPGNYRPVYFARSWRASSEMVLLNTLPSMTSLGTASMGL